jgi:hypothetical protein
VVSEESVVRMFGPTQEQVVVYVTRPRLSEAMACGNGEASEQAFVAEPGVLERAGMVRSCGIYGCSRGGS